VTQAPAGPNHHLALHTRTDCGFTIAVLSGALDAARVPALREQLFHLLRPATSQLVIDFALVSHADVGALAVLVGTARRARLNGGSLRLAAVTPAVALTLSAAGLDRQLDVFPTVQSAISS
jgi:anti-sigma B factor antagonist